MPSAYRRKPLAVVVCAHPFWNVPPLFNVAQELGRQGYRVIEIGYQAAGRPPRERLCDSVRIMRLPLHSRKVKIGFLRKILTTLEFLLKSRNILKRLRPSLLITFNEPASMLLPVKLGDDTVKTAWVLEYPEFELASFPERMLLKLSSACWSKAHILVAPTRERLALQIGLNPKCRERKSFVIHNGPLMHSPDAPASSLSRPAVQAIEELDTAKEMGFFRIVYSGAIGNRYGIDQLIEATGNSERGFLLLLGKKHDLSIREVKEALARCDDPDRISWIDEIPYNEMQHVLPNADLGFSYYIGDSINTRFSAPGKLYEYLKAGLLVLTDSDSCIQEILDAYGCGYFVDSPISVESLGAVLDLIGKDSELPARKREARSLFEEKLCMERQIEPYLHYLSSIGHPKPDPSIAE